MIIVVHYIDYCTHVEHGEGHCEGNYQYRKEYRQGVAAECSDILSVQIFEASQLHKQLHHNMKERNHKGCSGEFGYEFKYNKCAKVSF